MTMQRSTRKAGRPARATKQAAVESSPSACVTVRLTADELELVELHVTRTGAPRAVLIREAMHRMGLFGRARVSLEQG